ncbi:sortase [Desmospora activa]|nr:sortase [Desmospora activa]
MAQAWQGEAKKTIPSTPTPSPVPKLEMAPEEIEIGPSDSQYSDIEFKRNTAPLESAEPSIGETKAALHETGITWSDRPKEGEKIGTLSIPAIEVEIPIWEGVGDKELRKGVGHHPTPALPGEGDTAALAGHRETAFRDGKKIKEGDEMVVQTDEGTFTYQVRKIWIADADDRTVVASTGEPILRVYSCWPLSALFSGYAPERIVWEAELTHVEVE